MLTTSTKLICKSIENSITNFLKKMKKFAPPSLTQLPWTVSSRQLGGGRGRGIYSRSTKAPVGANQPVTNWCRCAPTINTPPLPLQAVVNSLFMAAEWGEGGRIFSILFKRLVILFSILLQINFVDIISTWFSLYT